VNGKVRSRIRVATAATKEELELSALTDSKIVGLIEALTVRKIIVVPGRLVNIVAN
jgi:leucyl-tRNA synthetase